MKKMKQICATFCDDNSQAVNVTIKENGSSRRIRISMESFVESILESAKAEENFQCLGAMPPGYVTGSISPSCLQKKKVVLQLPAEIRPILYYGKLYNIPFPSIVFLFETGKNRNVVNSYCFAADTDPLTQESTLYEYPFGNVYSNASICWGNISLPEIDSFSEFKKLIPLFFGAETNDDLWLSDITKSGAKTQRELIEMLSEKKVFPKEWLVLKHPAAEILF